MSEETSNGRDVRFWNVLPFVIACEIKTCIVLRIFDGRRDLPGIIR
jgi:hypothetical protein